MASRKYRPIKVKVRFLKNGEISMKIGRQPVYRVSNVDSMDAVLRGVNAANEERRNKYMEGAAA